MTFFAWPEIEAFHNIRKFTHAHPEILKGNSVVTYRGKVKLHGTNAAVQVHDDGTVVAQSRTQVITESNDNAGFARWVKETEAAWRDISNRGVVVYGEWCGPGIQKGVAISSIPQRVFAVFGVKFIQSDLLVVEPEFIKKYVAGVPNTYVLPWHDAVKIDWTAAADDLKPIVESINEKVLAVEQNDPWVEETFGVKGTGEGLVYYPFFEGSYATIVMEDFSNLVFKAKGEKHKNIKTAAPAQVDASVATGADAFADMVLTESRLVQGATAVSSGGALEYNTRNVGKFLQWVSGDVQKETGDELAASGLTWKQVEKSVQTKARLWYIERTKQL